MSPAAESALVVCRFLHDSSAIFLWGAFGFLSTLAPPQFARTTARRLGPASVVATILVVLSVLAMLPLKTAMIAGGWRSAFDPQTLATVLTATHIGTAWIASAVASLLLAATFVLPHGPRMAAMAVAAGLVLSSLALTGHAVIREGLVGHLQQANDVVHVLASGAWVGALVPLALILVRAPTADTDAARKRVVERFSVAGRIAVALTLLTGVVNTWLIVGGWPIDWAYPYQVLLVMKIMLVIAMIALAGTNHLRFTSSFQDAPASTAAAIRKGAIGEIMLGLSVIALVAVFGMLNPGP